MAPTPLTLAETASVFGEMLTFRALLAATADPAMRKSMLAAKVEDMLNTVVRQIAFYKFERKVHTERKNGELTAETINALWMSVQAESLGPAIRLGPGYETYWSYIGHFIHSPFYVYAYAFGDCLVNSLYGVYERSHEGFAERYLAMLAAGGTKHHAELLAPFGLDARDPGVLEDRAVADRAHDRRTRGVGLKGRSRGRADLEQIASGSAQVAAGRRPISGLARWVARYASNCRTLWRIERTAGVSLGQALTPSPLGRRIPASCCGQARNALRTPGPGPNMSREQTSTNGILAEQIEFTQIDAECCARVRRLKSAIDRELPAALDKFYDRVRATPEVKQFFANDAHIAAAKGAQIGHWGAISSGNFDDRYFEHARAIGLAHARTGLEPRWYIGGYALILESLIQSLVQELWPKALLGRGSSRAAREAGAALGSIVKAVLLDMDIAISVYTNAVKDERDKRQAEVEAEAKARAMVVDSIGAGLTKLAGKDLSYRMSEDMPEAYRKLQNDYNGAVEQLAEAFGGVSKSRRRGAFGHAADRSAANDLSPTHRAAGGEP